MKIIHPSTDANIITTHQHLDLYPVSPESARLIVGTIHPHDHERFLIPFFYGNRNSIWTILSEAFPKDLPAPVTLEKVLSFLEKHKISVSDTIRVCKRNKPSALDQDLVPLELNTQLIEQVKNSKIREILFTSGFGKNNAFKLFYVDMLGMKITPQIRKDREVMLDKSVFGRPVKLTILYSPSGAAMVPLSTSSIYLETKHKYIHSSRPVYDFRIDYYREKFSR